MPERPARRLRGVQMLLNVLLASVAAVLAVGCSAGPMGLPPTPEMIRPQTVVLFATPKFLADFAAPDSGIARFLDHYAPMISRAERTIVIFAVGNSEHVLTYRGRDGWADTVQWARMTDGKFVPGFDRTMHYTELAGIVAAFHRAAGARGIPLTVYDQVDPGNEFTMEFFKLNRHPECMDLRWMSYDVRARLAEDPAPYASAPTGIAAGTGCGTFLVDQVRAYMTDLGFDGILYGNQFGTRGRWLPENGPGYSAGEAEAIIEFLAYSRQQYGSRGLMWFDSYNDVRVEREAFSFPSDGYGAFDYVMAAGFCVVSHTDRYVQNLLSKVDMRDSRLDRGLPAPRVLATLDWVDPWYTYNSMTAFASESEMLERVATAYRDRIDGVVFFANDEKGNLVPASHVEAFVRRFYAPR